jgi:hypothetical protein
MSLANVIGYNERRQKIIFLLLPDNNIYISFVEQMKRACKPCAKEHEHVASFMRPLKTNYVHMKYVK